MIRLVDGCSHRQRDPPGHPSALVLCALTEWRCPLSSHLGTVAACSFQVALSWCRDINIQWWWTQKSVRWPVKRRFTSQKSIQVLFAVLGEVGARSGGIKGHFDALSECAKHSSQYGTLSRLSFDSVLTTVDVELANSARILHHLQRELLLFCCMIFLATCCSTNQYC